MSESVPIVTDASQGIDRATAIRLARDFSGIVLVARDFQHLNETATHVKSAGAEPLMLDLELSRPISAHPSEAP
jgi:3-oxoacyl-[acyl-carrier protein] reductase